MRQGEALLGQAGGTLAPLAATRSTVNSHADGPGFPGPGLGRSCRFIFGVAYLSGKSVDGIIALRFHPGLHDPSGHPLSLFVRKSPERTVASASGRNGER